MGRAGAAVLCLSENRIRMGNEFISAYGIVSNRKQQHGLYGSFLVIPVPKAPGTLRH